MIAAVFLATGLLISVSARVENLTPQMAWNSWNKFACDISESLIKETADALVESGLADAGYNHINLDDCWQSSERNADGSIQADPERFPSGLKSLGEYIHSKGLKFGIYSSAGFKTCQGYPAGLGREVIDAKSYTDWGVDYLKYDNCYEDRGPPQKRFSAMGYALQQQERDIFFSLCEWGRENPAVWASDIGGDSWRISPDISDGWISIISRAAIGASLWRYAGPNIGWNDPDMLEVGNGGCSLTQYRTHMSLWAMLKAPLILGNDIRNITADPDVLSLLINPEVIAVNQDALGLQARITWSDVSDRIRASGGGDKLIATKCSANKDEDSIKRTVMGVAGLREQYVAADDRKDQEWIFEEDGRIRSASTGLCLKENDGALLWEHGTDKASLADVFTADMLDTDVTAMLNFSSPLRSVSTSDCDATDVTKWETGRYLGGSIVSTASGLCLEVNKFEFYPSAQGKRIQTAPCQDTLSNEDRGYLDIREHQSWTNPDGLPSSRLLNLYQRQCLTVDRDAHSGMKEVWTSLLSEDGAMAVLLVNKGPLPTELTLTMDMLGQFGQLYADDVVFTVRDLWTQRDLIRPFSYEHANSFKLDAYGSLLLKLSPRK